MDEAVNEVVEVVRNSSCTMLEKATKEDIAALQSLYPNQHRFNNNRVLEIILGKFGSCEKKYAN